MSLAMIAETYWQLMRDPAHWGMELTLMAIFDGLVGYVGFKIIWPRVKAHFHSDLEHAGHDHEPDVGHGEGEKHH